MGNCSSNGPTHGVSGFDDMHGGRQSHAGGRTRASRGTDRDAYGSYFDSSDDEGEYEDGYKYEYEHDEGGDGRGSGSEDALKLHSRSHHRGSSQGHRTHQSQRERDRRATDVESASASASTATSTSTSSRRHGRGQQGGIPRGSGRGQEGKRHAHAADGEGDTESDGWASSDDDDDHHEAGGPSALPFELIGEVGDAGAIDAVEEGEADADENPGSASNVELLDNIPPVVAAYPGHHERARSPPTNRKTSSGLNVRVIGADDSPSAAARFKSTSQPHRESSDRGSDEVVSLSRVRRRAVAGSARVRVDAAVSGSGPGASGGRWNTKRLLGGAGISRSSVQVARLGIAGLANFGNTCFLNTGLQCLSHTLPLTEYFLSPSWKKDINTKNPLGSKGVLATSYAGVMSKLWLGERQFIVPSSFRRRVARLAPMFADDCQHDVQEFMAFLLDGLHEDLNRIDVVSARAALAEVDASEAAEESFTDSNPMSASALPNAAAAAKAWWRHLQLNKSVIVDLFQGQMKSVLACLTCGYASTTFDPFMYLSLPLQASRRKDAKAHNIYQALDLFSTREVLDGIDCWYCPHCRTHRPASKQLTLWRAPPILIIHFKRFSFNKYGERRKVNRMIRFPLEGLDLSRHVEGPCAAGDSFSYDLYAVADHHGGGSEEGHYTASALQHVTGDWHEFNDSYVARLSLDEVETSNAYMLFYARTASNPAHASAQRHDMHTRPTHGHAAGASEDAPFSRVLAATSRPSPEASKGKDYLNHPSVRRLRGDAIEVAKAQVNAEREKQEQEAAAAQWNLAPTVKPGLPDRSAGPRSSPAKPLSAGNDAPSALLASAGNPVAAVTEKYLSSPHHQLVVRGHAVADRGAAKTPPRSPRVASAGGRSAPPTPLTPAQLASPPHTPPIAMAFSSAAASGSAAGRSPRSAQALASMRSPRGKTPSSPRSKSRGGSSPRRSRSPRAAGLTPRRALALPSSPRSHMEVPGADCSALPANASTGCPGLTSGNRSSEGSQGAPPTSPVRSPAPKSPRRGKKLKKKKRSMRRPRVVTSPTALDVAMIASASPRGALGPLTSGFDAEALAAVLTPSGPSSKSSPRPGRPSPRSSFKLAKRLVANAAAAASAGSPRHPSSPLAPFAPLAPPTPSGALTPDRPDAAGRSPRFQSGTAVVTKQPWGTPPRVPTPGRSSHLVTSPRTPYASPAPSADLKKTGTSLGVEATVKTSPRRRPKSPRSGSGLARTGDGARSHGEFVGEDHRDATLY